MQLFYLGKKHILQRFALTIQFSASHLQPAKYQA